MPVTPYDTHGVNPANLDFKAKAKDSLPHRKRYFLRRQESFESVYLCYSLRYPKFIVFLNTEISNLISKINISATEKDYPIGPSHFLGFMLLFIIKLFDKYQIYVKFDIV